MSKLKQIFLCIAIFSASLLHVELNGQSETLKLSSTPVALSKVLAQAKANSPQLRKNILTLSVAEAEARSARDWWVPDAGVGVQMHQQNGAAMNGDGRFFLDINRQNFAAGANVGVSWDLKDAFLGTGAAELNAQAEEQSNVNSSNALLGMVTRQYYALQSAQLKREALLDFVDYADRIAQQLDAFSEAGLALRSDYIAAQANHRKFQLKERQFAREQSYVSEQLKFVLGLSADSTLLIVDTIAVLVDQMEVHSADSVVLNHPLYRAELLKGESIGKAQKAHGVGLALPSLDANFAFGQFGDIFSATDVNDQPIDALHNTTAFYGTLAWRVPIEDVFGGGKNGVLKAQHKLQMQEVAIKKDEISTAIRQATKGAEQTYEGYLFAEESVAFAKEAYNQSLERQKNGIASAYELFLAQEVYLNATLSWIEMRYELAAAVVKLRVVRGDLF